MWFASTRLRGRMFKNEASHGRLPARIGPLAVLLAASWLGSVASAQVPSQPAVPSRSTGAAQDNPYSLRIPAPPLDGGEWVNTQKPLSLEDFRGRYVLLDFWTYCCINCMHILPELKKLEHAFPEELVVIGVHSAKFAGEQVTENIREAALRYEIEHPIINDANLTIWRRYSAQSWPTLVLIDPEGYVVWAASGERDFEQMKAAIDQGLRYYRRHKLLKPGPRPEIIGTEKLPNTPLQFPGKVLVDEPGGRLFIADSNHNRIVVADLNGRTQFTIGSGVIGRVDGAFTTCSFNHPQGMALAGDILYVADTENHLIRAANLKSQKVTTLAGNGKKGTAIFEGARAAPRKTALASPWSLCAHENELYIAMAGPHQIWKMRLPGRELAAYAGNGREDIVDGPLLPATPYELGYSSFAQPSELSTDGQQLFVADSEGSTIRAVPFDKRQPVTTLVGLTGTLFDFGDIDGQGPTVRLQHPLGVAWTNGSLYVADTYNNKIKVIDINQRTCRTIAGSGKSGNQDSATGVTATFNEPGGIGASNSKLYVADTNNHVIRIVDLAPPYQVSTLKLEGLDPPIKSEK